MSRGTRHVVTVGLTCLVLVLCCTPGPLSWVSTLVCIAACVLQAVLARA